MKEFLSHFMISGEQPKSGQGQTEQKRKEGGVKREAISAQSLAEKLACEDSQRRGLEGTPGALWELNMERKLEQEISSRLKAGEAVEAIEADLRRKLELSFSDAQIKAKGQRK